MGYFGVLSAAAAWRKELIPRPVPAPVRLRRLRFAALLHRTFGIELLQCPRCEGKMKVVAVVLEPAEVERLCANLGQATEAPPVHPSRYRRQMQPDFAEPEPP